MPSDTPSSSSSSPRSGYTLPVFACASAIAALHKLRDPSQSLESVELNLIHPEQLATIPIEQVATLPDGAALAITRSDPGDNLDLTRHTPVWALVQWRSATQTERIHIDGGEGLGRQLHRHQQPAVYAYARTLLKANLKPLLPPDKAITVTIILPAGRSLALRTSNAAFGVVDGLSLLGTSGISEPLSAPGQLEAFRENLREQAQKFSTLVFCIGENGLHRALTLGIPPERRIKTGNWIGPLLVEAALCDVQGILLLGYHGKLVKLAGGIFHTHHYVADGRLEILSALAVTEGLPTPDIQPLLQAPTVEAGLDHLRQRDQATSQTWVDRIYAALVDRIDERSAAYIHAHTERQIAVGSAVFDRQREIIAISDRGSTLLQSLLVS
jgi:cobalt-precorrin-5B (C1)-methyltransferase